jgi:hypothetical protein
MQLLSSFLAWDTICARIWMLIESKMAARMRVKLNALTGVLHWATVEDQGFASDGG